MAIENDMEKIVPAIFCGIKRVLDKQIMARGFDDVSCIKPEYVFTVGIFNCVVSALNGADGEYPGDANYVVRMEEPFRYVKFRSFPAYVVEKVEGAFPKFIYQVSKVIRNKRGKVDIAIYYKTNGGTHQEETTCLIEVKGFNPSRAEIKKDLKRLSELKSMTQPTGASCLKKSYLAYLVTADPFSEVSESDISLKECDRASREFPGLQFTPDRVRCKIIDQYTPDPQGYAEGFEPDASEFYRWFSVVVEV